jgi:hypothetical protein
MDQVRRGRDKLNRDKKLTREVRRTIGEHLRGVYQELVGRPLPTGLIDLVRRLECGEVGPRGAQCHAGQRDGRES